MNLNKNILFIITLFLTIFTGSALKPALGSDLFSIKIARYGHAVVNDGKKIYVLAGGSTRGFRSDIEVVDPTTRKIDVLTGLLIRRRFFSAVFDGKHSIYILGGMSVINRKTRLEKRVEVFDTITHKVHLAKPLPFPTRTNSAVFLNGNIYVFGGEYSPKGFLVPSPIVTVFNIAKNKWMRAADMPTSKSTQAAVKNGLVYVVGGFDGKKALNVFERYNPAINSNTGLVQHWIKSRLRATYPYLLYFFIAVPLT